MPRLGRYFVVSALGFGVQLVSVWLLTASGVRPALFVAATAVGLAALHNFAWHSAWTWRDRDGYSARSARKGSMRAARQAGIRAATVATTISSAVAATNVAGSRGDRP